MIQGMICGDSKRSLLPALRNLAKLGIKLRTDEETISRVVEIWKRIEAVGADAEWEDRLMKLKDVDFIAKEHLLELAQLLSMKDKDFDEFARLHRELRRLLRSRLIQSNSAKR